jgi:hypothetical protein
MRRELMVLFLIATACGGTQIPQHNGYKSEKYKPWKKFKTLKFNEKGEAKYDGDLSYPDRHRAAWFAADLPINGELDIRVEIVPPGDATNDMFDLGLEILDPGYRMLIRKDLDEGDSQQDLNKTAMIKDQPPGRYWVHLYLQGRLDTCEYTIHATFKAAAPTEVKSDFPAQVSFLDPLPMVPLTDDTPKNYHAPTTTVVVTTKKHHPRNPTPPPPPPPATTISARIISVSVSGGSTKITVGRGTATGASAGMHGKINGVANGAFTLAGCNERACTATLQGVTPDQIKGSGQVTLMP